MTLSEALRVAAVELERAGFAQSQMEARELLKALTGRSLAELISHDSEALSDSESARFEEWLGKRVAGMPLAYLSREKGFFKHVFAVEKGVLIPRPETELVVETALDRAGAGVRHMADWGAGTGCIGLSLACEWTQARLWSVEVSPRAAALVVRNAERLGVYDRTHVDCVAVESWNSETQLDLIVANPPYVPDNDPRVERSVHEFEPHLALYSGIDGLTAAREWIPRAAQLLNPDGLCVFEIGSGQDADVRAIMIDAGLTALEVREDLNGIPRVVSAKKRI